MKIERFEDIEAWQLARWLTQNIKSARQPTVNPDHKIPKCNRSIEKRDARKRNPVPDNLSSYNMIIS